MLALRLASLGAAALSFALSLSTCGGSTESGAGPEPQKQAPAAEIELAGVDTSSLTPRERREWSSYVSEQLAPCKDTPVPIAQCVREKRACKRCLPAARFLVTQVRNGGAREQVLDAYRSRFDNDRVKNVDVADTPMKGAPTAPITVVEWADFQCPFCKAASPALDELVTRFPGKVKLYFKNYPLPAHNLAEAAARAAIAAEAQGKFWEMHHKLFESSPAGLEARGLESHARELGLKLDRFKADMESEATTARIAREKKQAETLGFSGTPLIYINGREFPLRGDFPTELTQWVKLELELLGESSQPVAPAASSAPAPSASPGGPQKPAPPPK
ncbi:MAG TPA: thioredoxin domain-containing protein [Polyangiaceae bacterium]|nr:thioredoxin domain-containing protein [Polyangiaceae bacterium]